MQMQDERPLAIALMGPTASGKTALAMDWAQRFDAEIISVDSALVYRGLNIGAAKPSAAEQKQAPHHLIDIREPWESFSAADFAQEALSTMQKVQSQKKLPLLVGGTGLYFRALLDGLSAMPAADENIRADIEQRARAIGWAALHQQLAMIDPAAGERIKPADTQRITRALEVYEVSGKPISEWQQQRVRQRFPYRVLRLCIAPKERALLHQRIEQRFDTMLAQGFLAEMKHLRENTQLHSDLPSMRAVGYRQAWRYLDGETNVTQFRDEAIAATRQLAKRQLTWFRGELDLRWFDPQLETEAIESAVKLFITRR
jgi:tRNA dimethylallyltransferase